MPMPVSSTSTRKPNSQRRKRSATCPSEVNFRAFSNKLLTICISLLLSLITHVGNWSSNTKGACRCFSEAWLCRLTCSSWARSGNETGCNPKVMRCACSCEKSKMSLTTANRCWVDSRITSTRCKSSGACLTWSFKTPLSPRMAFMGVRSS